MLYFFLLMHFYSHFLFFFKHSHLFQVKSFQNHFLSLLYFNIFKMYLLFYFCFVYQIKWQCLYTSSLVFSHLSNFNYPEILLYRQTLDYYYVWSKVLVYRFTRPFHEQFSLCFFFDILKYLTISFYFWLVISYWRVYRYFKWIILVSHFAMLFRWQTYFNFR